MLGELLEVQCHHQQQIDILKIPLCLKLLPLYPVGRKNNFTATAYINRQDGALATTMLKLADNRWYLVLEHLIPLRRGSGEALGRQNYICFAEVVRHYAASIEHRAAVHFILGNAVAGNALSQCVAI